MKHPVFSVGSDDATVFEDVRNLTLIEMTRKYPMLCTSSLMHLMKYSFGGKTDHFVSSTGSDLSDEGTFEQQAVTLETLQEIAVKILG